MFVIKVSGRGDDQVAGSEAFSVMTGHHGALEAFHRVARAKNRFAEGVIFPETLREDFVHKIVGTVFVHLDFFEDHAALAGDVVNVEYGMQHQVTQDVECDGNVLIENLDVEADTFLGSECVHVAADGVHLTSDRFRGAVLGALEHHVLDEVRDSVPFRVFIAGTGFEPDADRNRAQV